VHPEEAGTAGANLRTRRTQHRRMSCCRVPRRSRHCRRQEQSAHSTDECHAAVYPEEAGIAGANLRTRRTQHRRMSCCGRRVLRRGEEASPCQVHTLWGGPLFKLVLLSPRPQTPANCAQERSQVLRTKRQRRQATPNEYRGHQGTNVKDPR
jgi:hypothetical protein